MSDVPLPPNHAENRRAPKTPPWVRLWRLAQKELRETLRDRRTIVTLVLMPILVYPLLSIAFRQSMLSSFASQTNLTWSIAGENKETLTGLGQQLEIGGQLLRRIDGPAVSPDGTKSATPPGEPAETPIPGDLAQLDLSKARWFKAKNVEDAVRDGDADLGVRVRERVIKTPGFPDFVQYQYELIYQPESPISRAAVDFVERRLWAVNQYILRSQLRSMGASDDVANRWRRQPVQGAMGQMISMATLVPLVLLLMTITGAVYPAIDLTAGERERGTLESLMAAPLPRLSMLLAKYIAVLTVALLTAGANLAAMSLTIYSTGLGPALFGERGLGLASIAAVLCLLLLFAAFFSALLLAVTSFARSFKEAQAYLIPFMMLAISPGFLTIMPGVESSRIMSVVPLVNIVLLARDLLQGSINPLFASAAVISTALYALAALTLAARVFGSDAILYGSQGTWSDLFRRPDELPCVASLSGAALCAAIVFALQVEASSLLALSIGGKPGESTVPLETQLLLTSGLAGILYFAVPLGIARLQFIRLSSGFQLRLGSPWGYIGAVLLGLSLWPFAHELVVLSKGITWISLDFQKLAGDELFAKIRQLSPVFLVATMAIVPAVCEEWFFRGYLLGALRHRLPPWAGILLTAVLFGLFHVFVSGSLGGVRLLPSTCLGVVLGWVCWRTRSVLPGMLLHSVHNGFLVLVARYQDELLKAGIGVTEEQHLPLLWLAMAAVGIAAGLLLVWLGGRRELGAAAAEVPAAATS